MESLLIIILLIAIFWFFSGNELKAAHKKEEISRKESFEKFEKLIDSSNAKILAWTFNKRASDTRNQKRIKVNRQDGIPYSEYLGSGYIYVSPCAPKEEVWKNFRFRKKYRYAYKDRDGKNYHGRASVTPPDNYKKLMNMAKTICEDYPNYTIYDERPFKIGYTTRDVNSRILELNDTNETNYKYWQFYYWKGSEIYIATNIEKVEKAIHSKLRLHGKHVVGEIFCAKWTYIKNIVRSISGKNISYP